jgi:hypothetical protein
MRRREGGRGRKRSERGGEEGGRGGRRGMYVDGNETHMQKQQQ